MGPALSTVCVRLAPAFPPSDFRRLPSLRPARSFSTPHSACRSTHTDPVHPCVCRCTHARLSTAPQGGAPFEGTTTSRAAYHAWGQPERDARVSTRRPRGEVEAQAGAGGGGGQFDGATTSRVDYVPHMIGVQNVGPVRVLFRK